MVGRGTDKNGWACEVRGWEGEVQRRKGITGNERQRESGKTESRVGERRKIERIGVEKQER